MWQQLVKRTNKTNNRRKQKIKYNIGMEMFTFTQKERTLS